MSQPPQENPFADRPTYQNPYAPGTTSPPPRGSDPALGTLAPFNTSIWAIAAGYLGLLSPVVCWLSPFAIFCGVMAPFELSRMPGTRGHARAIVGIALGSLRLLGLVWMLIFIAVG